MTNVVFVWLLILIVGPRSSLGVPDANLASHMDTTGTFGTYTDDAFISSMASQGFTHFPSNRDRFGHNEALLSVSYDVDALAQSSQATKQTRAQSIQRAETAPEIGPWTIAITVLSLLVTSFLREEIDASDRRF